MPEWFGHPSARRQETTDGWFYEDNGNMALAFMLAGSKGSMFLWDIDAFIEALEAEGVGAGAELRERRQKAYEAFRRTGNDLFHDSCIRHIEWIMQRIREIKIADKAKPLIEIGRSSRDGYKDRRDALEKEEVRSYAREHWRRSPGDAVGAVLRIDPIAPFKVRYNKRTLHDWIKDLKPGGTRRGRPRRTKP